MNTPVLVYLDQSAWSAIDDAPTASFTRQLSAWATSDMTRYLITPEILIETSPLKQGRMRRWETLREFPGTVSNFQLTVERLRKLDGASITAHAQGHVDSSPVHLELRPFGENSVEDLEAITSKLLVMLHALKAAAFAQRIAGRADRGKTKAQRQEEERSTAALLRGDLPTFFELSGRTLTPTQRTATRHLGAVASRLARRAQTLGLLAPIHRRLDPIATACLLPHLDPHVRKDATLLRRITTIWNGPERAAVVPSLACDAAVFERARNQAIDSDKDYPDSEELDRRHASFAPLVRVFTCDKRNAGPLRKVLTGSGRSIAVAVAGRPAEVISAIQQTLAKG